jgi:hypothetical protein
MDPIRAIGPPLALLTLLMSDRRKIIHRHFMGLYWLCNSFYE